MPLATVVFREFCEEYGDGRQPETENTSYRHQSPREPAINAYFAWAKAWIHIVYQ